MQRPRLQIHPQAVTDAFSLAVLHKSTLYSFAFSAGIPVEISVHWEERGVKNGRSAAVTFGFGAIRGRIPPKAVLSEGREMHKSPDIFTKFTAPTVALAVSSVALMAGTALAQDGETRAPRTTLEEIVVQTEKRAASQQTVPVAVTAVTGRALERKFAQDFRDLTSSAPNVLLEPVGSFQNASSFFIRGAGSSDIESAADPGIAVFIDGVYQARTSTALVDFLDVEAVEILRGPQGTLFGRNAIGGAVLLRHIAPDVDEFNVRGSVLAGQFGRLDIKGVINVPLIEGKAAFRLAFKSTNSDGYHTNVTTGEKAGGTDRITILPSLRFTDENLDIIIRGEYNRIRDDYYPTTPHNACRTDPADGIVPSGNDLVINLAALFGGGENARKFCATTVGAGKDYLIYADNSIGDGSVFDVWGITADVNYDIPDIGTITYVGNYRDVLDDVANDFDTTDFLLFETTRTQNHYQTSHELRFASDFSDLVDFIVGVYYFKQHYMMIQNGFGVILGGQALGRSEQWHEQWALFGQANWHISDMFTLVTGVRYTEEDKDFLHCGVGFGSVATQTCDFDNQFLSFNSDTDVGDGLKANGVAQNRGVTEWSNVSPKIGINAHVTDDLFAYVSWTRGFRSGGFNGRGNTTNTAGPFDEEKADSYEFGAKWDGLDNRLRVNVTLFWTQFNDLQRTIIRPAEGSGGQETVTDNAAKARSRGVEVEIMAIPTQGLTVAGSLGYLDATTLDFCSDLNGPLPTPAGKELCGVQDAALGISQFQNAGLDILRAPEWTMNLNIAYEMAVGDAGFLTFSANYLHRTSMSLISAGFPPGTLDGVDNFDGVNVSARRKGTHIIDLQATYDEIEGRYRVSFFWKNITKETYLNSGTYVAGLFNFAQRNVPRHWGVEIAFDL